MCKLSINEIGRKITKNKLILQYIFVRYGQKKIFDRDGGRKRYTHGS
jgi:hypothetical protein